MKTGDLILGIDIGSVSIHIALLDREKKITHCSSLFHKGEIKKTTIKLLEKIDLTRIAYVATTDDTPEFVRSCKSYDDQLCLIRSGRLFHHYFDALLHVGGEKFSLSQFDSRQNYIGASHNTSCAAGTGGFLDQQAKRLHLENGSEELSQRAIANVADIPQIATRCAVFAKTDLIHAQQEGYGIDQICDGLCHGLAKNLANTLFKNKKIEGQILFSGGVSQNAGVVRHLEKITGQRFTIDPYASQYGAIGAALCLVDALSDPFQLKQIYLTTAQDLFAKNNRQNTVLYPPLSLSLSKYPDFVSFDSRQENGIETDLYIDPEKISSIEGYIGIDVGSTSTKSILIDQNLKPIAGFYTKTASRPVIAVQNILNAYDRLFKSYGIKPIIKGCGTTGSGRRISAKIIGADIEPDEITAHATAACHLNPGVDTIIEIGGQDAKFTTLKNGVVTSSIMNTVCAAGTGSFIEEQAIKLGCPLSEYSSQAEGVQAPMASDRCTVFMERDINHYFAQGYTRNEVLASVLHSVRDNYLTKVANIAKIGDCVLFQGATAKNKALVSAFEQKLKKPIHVSKFCHLTGALGVALMAHEKRQLDPTGVSGFKGFDLWKKQIPVRQEICSLCQNNCKLTIANVDGKNLAYGFLCGRDYDTQRKVAFERSHDLLTLRKKDHS